MESTTHARRLDVRLFMEGIEVDVTSLKLSCGVNQPATATITIPSCDEVHSLLPRTLVHVFYFDSRWELGTYRGKDATQTNWQESGEDLAKAKEKGVATLLRDKDNWHNWKLLFVGEVMGYSFSKIGGRRDIILACQDHTSYWDNCRVYWGKKRSSVFNSYKTAVFSGATQLYRGKSKVDSSGDLIKLLQAKPSAMPNVPGLMGGIFSVLEAATGCYSPDAKKKFHGCNDFLSQAEIRLKLTRQIGASTDDDTSATFTNSKSFKRYLRKVSKQVKYTATFMQFINMLCGKIYHTWHSQLAPPYFSDSAVITTEYVLSGKAKFTHNGKLSADEKAAKKTYSLGNKQTSDALKDRRTIDRKPGEASQIANDTYKRAEDGKLRSDKHKEFDETNTGTGIMSNPGGLSGTDRTDITDITKDPYFLKGQAIKVELNEKAATTGDKTLRKRGDRIQQAYKCLAEARIRASQLLGAQTAHGNDYAAVNKDMAKLKHDSDNLFYIRRKLECYLKGIGSATGRTVVPKREQVKLRDRLYTTYFHPDVYMCPPPRCNVLFPDHIQAIRFSRNWMSEITRLWLHGKTSSGRNKKDCYFSPNAEMLAGPTVTDCAQAVKKGGGFVMKHEKYTGIIPSIMGLGDGDVFKKMHKKEMKEAKKKWKEEKGSLQGFDKGSVSGEAKFSPQPHLQRAANYMFFAQRYGTRTMAITARYSPQLVPGMPCLVLDPVRQDSRILHAVGGEGDNKDKIRGKDTVNLSAPPKGTHYVGQIAEIVHTIDVSGGAQTLIQLIKVRGHREDAGLFGDTKDGKITTERSYTRHGKKPVKAKDGQPHTAFITNTNPDVPGGVVIQSSPDAANRVLGPNEYKKGRRYLIKARKTGGNYNFSNKAPQGDDNAGTRVLLGADGKPNASAVDGSGYNAVEVDVYRYVSYPAVGKVSFTFESTLMPPWLSPIYHPGSIGTKYYMPMYGCESVLDNPPIMFQPGADKPKPVTRSVTTGAEISGNESGIATVSVPFKMPDSGIDRGGGVEYTELRIPEDLTQAAKTTEAAADQLADTWLALKEIGAATDLFIDGYIDRKYANMVEVMGNMNPGFAPKVYDQQAFVDDDYRQGIPTRGFHGDAFGPYTQMNDWEGKEIVPTILPVLAKDPMNPRDLDKDIDPRWHRYNRVRKYLAGLRKQGFRDVGGSLVEEMDDDAGEKKRAELKGYDHKPPKSSE